MARPAVLTVADTIAKSFLLAVETRGDRPAIREKKFGVWQPTSWRQWLQISREIAYGLHAIGFEPGDVASIIANAVPEWVFADMGVLCAGGVCSGIYPTDSAAQVEYLVNDSRTTAIFAEDEEQLDKILSCRARCPSLRKVILVNGCFWHRHAGCDRATTPTRNRWFWTEKFEANKRRDRRRTAELRKLGYQVLVV